MVKIKIELLLDFYLYIKLMESAAWRSSERDVEWLLSNSDGVLEWLLSDGEGACSASS